MLLRPMPPAEAKDAGMGGLSGAVDTREAAEGLMLRLPAERLSCALEGEGICTEATLRIEECWTSGLAPPPPQLAPPPAAASAFMRRMSARS